MKRIFLAEDDADDQEIFQAIISGLDEPVDLTVVDNGENLIKHIESCSDEALPHLIVLDQNMPRLNGYDTIQILKGRKRFEKIPMVIYSTYHDTMFVANCQRENIELLLKPDTFEAFERIINYIVKRYVWK